VSDSELRTSARTSCLDRVAIGRGAAACSRQIIRVRDEGPQGFYVSLNLMMKSPLSLRTVGLICTRDFTGRQRELIKQKRVADIEGIGPRISERTYLDEAYYQAANYLGHKASNPGSRRIIIGITDTRSNQPSGVGHPESNATRALPRDGRYGFGW